MVSQQLCFDRTDTRVKPNLDVLVERALGGNASWSILLDLLVNLPYSQSCSFVEHLFPVTILM